MDGFSIIIVVDYNYYRAIIALAPLLLNLIFTPFLFSISLYNKNILFREMKFKDFKLKIKDLPIFSSSFSGYLDSNEQAFRNQLSHWKKQGLILELKRGLYVLNEDDRKITPSRVFLANQLYPPSYISTEYALMYYDLIPERVADVTSITTRKTAKFENNFGLFVFQHLPPDCFNGFILRKDENNHTFLIATPEKALVDFIYLNLANFKYDEPEIFEQSYRLQNYESLNSKKMLNFAASFKNKKLLSIVNMFTRLTRKAS